MSQDFSTLFADGVAHHAAPGAHVFRTGDPVLSIFLVEDGEVRLLRHTRDGRALILTRAGPGDVLAEASAYARAYHCDAEAGTAARLRAMPKARFLERLAQDPALSAKWAARLARGMQAARLRAEFRTLPRVADRLDAWLDAGECLPEKGRWQEVAAALGVSREALYREMARRRGAEAARGGRDQCPPPNTPVRTE